MLSAQRILWGLSGSPSDQRSPARVTMGRGRGILRAVEEAVGHARKRRGQVDRSKWLKLDIVQKSYPRSNVDLGVRVKMDRSLFGMAFGKQSGVAFLPEELVALTLIDSKGVPRKDKLGKYLGLRIVVDGKPKGRGK